jgi:DNA-binding SARP family transcriptional activator
LIASSAIRIFLLGRFETVRGQKILPAADWPRRKAAALLQRLALSRRLLRDEAIDFLWPEADLASGANNLYRTLHVLRQTLDTALGPGTAEATFTFADGALTLIDSVWVDAHEFEQQAQAALLNLQSFGKHSQNAAQDKSPTSSLQPPISNLQSALELYAGDLLPDDVYADWLAAPRESLRRLHREAQLKLAVHHREAGDHTRALALLTPLVARDRADEVAHRELMRTYALAGRRHDALRQYQACVEALAVELDVPPEPETAALYSQILSGDAPSPATVPPSLSSFPQSLQSLDAETEERSTPMVGRESELESLRLWLRTAWRGQGKIILITGDSGVGKTRLALEALRAAASAGMTTLFGAAYEQEGQLPYQPFVEAFDEFLSRSPRLPDGVEPSNPITHFKRLGVSDPQQEGWTQFKAVADFLSASSQSAPTVFLLDDLHAADEASLRLLHYLARHTRTAPVVLMATCRTDLSLSSSPFGTLINALYRERLSEPLTLAPLSPEATTQVLAQELGGEPSPALVAVVYDLTEGNPFYIQEMARALLKDDRVEARDGQWYLKAADQHLTMPAGLSGLLRERVTRLGSEVETTLITAAVIGREFSFDVLRGVALLPDSNVIAALDAALAARLLDESEYGYRFRHPLIRRELYDSLSRARRARLHSQTAEAIEAIQSRQPGGVRDIEALAFHYDLSERRDRALPYLIQAGQKAASVYAFEVAVDYFERALALMEALDTEAGAQRWMVLESLGWWHTILADTPQAVKRFEQAAALPPTDRWQSGKRDRARVHRGAVMALVTAGDITGTESHLRAALTEVDENEDAAEYAHVLYNVAQVHWHRGEFQEAFNAAQHSLNVAERLNDTTAIARAFEMLALACHSLGEWQDGLHFEAQRATLAGSGLDVTEAFDVHL